jgi:hypothetical protein
MIRKGKMPVLFLTLMIITGILHSQTYDGYTLYGKMGSNSAYLVDMNHTNYHTWTFSSQTGYSMYLQPNHHLMRAVQHNGNVLQGAAMTGEVQDVDWNGSVTWDYVYSTSTYCTHHDIHVMPNGNVLLISYEVKSASEVTQAGGTQSIVMWPDKIVEVQPSGTSGGTIVWEWHAWDHLVQDHDPTKNNYGVVADHPELLNINYNQQKDWMHTNGIDFNATLNQIVFSSHNLNEIYVIDHSTTTAQAATHSGGNSGKGGDILYRWGNPAAYNRGTVSNQIFKVVHDAHWVPADCPKANDLVGFNNQGYTGNQSCVDIIAPPYTGYTYSITTGQAYLPSTYTWRHHCLGNAQDQSSSQQLPNGNMLICIASSGYIYEIDSNQTLLWSQTVGGTVPKAFRYTSCYVNGGITTSASATPAAVCEGGSVQLNVTASGGSSLTYAWTSIPAGFTSDQQSPTVAPTVTTTYICNVSGGGCSGSDSVTVTVTSQPTVTSSATPQTVCSGSQTQLYAYATGTVTYSYSWTSEPAGFTSSMQNPVAYPTETTMYIVLVSGGGCSAGDSVTVSVNPLPETPGITRHGDTLISSASSGNQWYLNGNSIPGATGQTYVTQVEGSYQVEVTDQNGCVSAMSDPLIYVGIVTTATADRITLFPNPTSGTLEMKGILSGSRYEVNIYNSWGKILLHGENLTRIDVSALDNGIYLLSLSMDNGPVWNSRFVVLK